MICTAWYGGHPAYKMIGAIYFCLMTHLWLPWNETPHIRKGSFLVLILGSVWSFWEGLHPMHDVKGKQQYTKCCHKCHTAPTRQFCKQPHLLTSRLLTSDKLASSSVILFFSTSSWIQARIWSSYTADLSAPKKSNGCCGNRSSRVPMSSNVSPSSCS